MIVSFGTKETRNIWEGNFVRGISAELQQVARRKLRMLNSSQSLNDLLIPPSNRLEKLRGPLRDFYSIRINDQYRIIFKWKEGRAIDVEIIDYH